MAAINIKPSDCNPKSNDSNFRALMAILEPFENKLIEKSGEILWSFLIRSYELY